MSRYEAEAERELFLYPGTFKTCANLCEGTNLGSSSAIMMSGEGFGCPPPQGGFSEG
jgi:hypothetical protein